MDKLGTSSHISHSSTWNKRMHYCTGALTEHFTACKSDKGSTCHRWRKTCTHSVPSNSKATLGAVHRSLLTAMLDFPGELLDAVFEHLKDDKKSLSACSRVSRNGWLSWASLRLFSTLKVHAVVMGSYVPDRKLSFADFLQFLLRCERASHAIRDLVLDGSWRPRFTPNGIQPVFVSSLAVDTLFCILKCCSELRALTLREVELAMPSLLYRVSAWEPVKLQRLTLDYRAQHPLMPPCGRPGFDIPSILPIFSLDLLNARRACDAGQARRAFIACTAGGVSHISTHMRRLCKQPGSRTPTRVLTIWRRSSETTT